MKKFIFLLSGGVCVLLLTFACQKNVNNEPLTKNPYEYVGVQHNEALNYVFQKVSEQKTKGGSLTDEKLTPSQIAQYCSEFLSSKGYEMTPEQSKRVTEGISSICGENTKAVQTPAILTLSTQQGFYIAKIQAALHSSSDATQLESAIISIENEILNNPKLSHSEQESLLCYAAVVKYSFVYWSQNISKWEQLTNRPTTRSFWGDIASAASCDGMGALWGSWSGCGALVSAAGFSVGYAANAIIDSIRLRFE